MTLLSGPTELYLVRPVTHPMITVLAIWIAIQLPLGVVVGRAFAGAEGFSEEEG